MVIKPLLLLLVLLYPTTQLSQTSTPLQIISVSDNPQTVIHPVYISAKGGKKIYINAAGFSQSAKDLSVTVGPYKCPITGNGVSSTYIVCQTTSLGQAKDNPNFMAITLTSGSKSVISTYPDGVFYSSGSTPVVNEVFPAASYANQTVAVQGSLLSNDVGNGV